MCGDHQLRDSLGGALAVLSPSPSQTGTSAMRMTGRLVFHNGKTANSMATHAIFTVDPSYLPLHRSSSTEPCLVKIHETGDLTRPATTSPSWAAFSLKPMIGATVYGEEQPIGVELERPLKIEVGADGIIGRRVSVWTRHGAGPVAEGIVGEYVGSYVDANANSLPKIMDLFRNAFNLWARRDPQPAPHHTDPEPDMPRRNGTPPTLTPENLITTSSSSLSSLNTTSTGYMQAEGTASARARRGVSTRDAAEEEEEDGGRDGDDGEQSDPVALLRYHSAKALPPELKEHCRVYLEEALPRQAIFLLDSLLATRTEDPREPAYCPPPSQISLLCSIIAHPDFTTRPRESDWPQISLQALVYLRDLLAVFGPINAGFKESVLFGTNATSDLDFESHAAHGAGIDADERGMVRLSPRHGSDSVWQRGRDFFSVVGWAFNCSALYPDRWQWWCRWLSFMLDLLDADINERHRLDIENGSDDTPLLQNSILASYITQRSGRTTDVVMWIMRALFADGSASSTSVFQEVWHRERKSRSHHTPNKRKREKVNIDKGEYGGYLDDESVHSSQASEPPTPQKKGQRLASVEEEVFQAAYVETIYLRQRLFSLVSYLSYSLADASPIDFSNLYQKFEQRIKELPLPVFSSFVNQSTSALRIDQQIEMLQGVLFLLVPPGALSPRKVDRVRFEEGGISPAILERCFLPYPANTIEVEDHVKMSLLLENLLMLVWQHGDKDEKFSGALGDAVRKGIEARWEKINKKKTRGRGKATSDGDVEARAALEASDSRLGWLAGAIEESDAGNDDDMSGDEDL